jgi:hypothetical protein
MIFPPQSTFSALLDFLILVSPQVLTLRISVVPFSFIFKIPPVLQCTNNVPKTDLHEWASPPSNRSTRTASSGSAHVLSVVLGHDRYFETESDEIPASTIRF